MQIPRPKAPAPPSINWPNVSPLTAWIALPVLAAVALGLGYLAGKATDTVITALLIVLALLAVGATTGVSILLVRSIAKEVSPLLLTPYGVTERQRAEKTVYRYITAPELPVLYVVEGKVRDDPHGEIFRKVGLGPAILYVDLQSVVMIEHAGKFELLHSGPSQLKRGDRLIGIANLGSQDETVELHQVLTRDTIPLDVKATVTFQLQQDMRYLEHYRSHQTNLEVMRRALLPKDEWQLRTRNSLGGKIVEIFSQLELWQLFMARPNPPASSAAAVPTMGQGVVPSGIRQDLENRIRRRLNEQCWQWGVEVTRVSLDEIAPPKEIRDAAYRAYMAWIDRVVQVEEAEKQAEVDLKLAQSRHEQAQLAKQSEIIRAETKAAAERQAAEIERQTAWLRAETEAEVRKKSAEAERTAEVLRAEAEAAALRLLMAAKTETGVELARRLELLQHATGRTLDDKVLREFLRAVGFLERDPPREESRARLLDWLRTMPIVETSEETPTPDG